MKLIVFLLTFYFSLPLTMSAQKIAAFKIYTKKGKKTTFKKLSKKAQKGDVILFGEFHNNPISHWLQLKLAKGLHSTRPLILGAEMLETDNQAQLNDYLNEKIDYPTLASSARLWSNFKTDYAPLVNFAKQNNLPFIATNIPRRYARMVHKNGGFAALDNLSEEEKAWVAPKPILFDPELPQYKNMLAMMGDHSSADIVKAQAIKDATMAYFILKNHKKGHTFLHLNGAYHSDFHEGILWYLQQQNADLNYLTISTVEQANIHQLDKENLGRADFIICVDGDMTKTY